MLTDIITDVKHLRNKGSQITLRDGGSFFIDRNFFFSKIWTGKQDINEKAAELAMELAQHNVSYKRIKTRVSPFQVLEVVAPESARKYLGKSFSRNVHWTEQVRGPLDKETGTGFANPSTWIEVDEATHALLLKKEEFNQGLESLRKEIDVVFSNKYLSYRTRVFNELNKLFFNDAQENISKNKYTKQLPQELIYRREQLQKTFDLINAHQDVRYNKDSNSLEMRLSLDSLNPLRQLSLEDYMKQKWAFVDIETPRFKDVGDTKNEISWIGVEYAAPNHAKKEIHTLSRLSPTTFTDVEIHRYDTEQELLEGFVRSFERENPLVVSAFNVSFDLLKIRERYKEITKKKLKKESRAVTEVSKHIKFFERLDMNRHEIVDLLAWSDLAFDYLPRNNLESTAKHGIPGVKFEKSATHSELGPLEMLARFDDEDALAHVSHLVSNSDEAKQFLAKYLMGTHEQPGDVRLLKMIRDSEAFKVTELISEIGNEFHVPFHWLIYSPQAIQLAQKRKYGRFVGLNKQDIYPESNSFDFKRVKDKDAVKIMRGHLLADAIEPHTGKYENVTKAFVPWGFYLKNLICRNFEEAKLIYERKPKEGKEFTRLERFLLHRYGNALASWMMTDYGAALRATEQLPIPFKTAEWIHGKNIPYSALKREQSTDKELKERKLSGNYSVYSKEVDAAFVSMYGKIKSFAKINGLKILHQGGEYIYFAGGTPETFTRENKFPLILADSIDEAIISRDKTGRHITYERYGEQNRRRRLNEKQLSFL